MIEPPEVFVFGPYMTNMFGKARHGHAEVRVRAAAPTPRAASPPCEPSISIGNMKSVVESRCPR